MNKTLIINTITAWDEPHRARHQLTFALAKKNYHLIFVARNEKGSRKIEKLRISDNITLIVPHFPVDYRFRYRLPLLNEQYQRWLYSNLAATYPDVPVVNFDFTAHRVFNYFKEVIYYCNDEYIGNSKYPNWFVNLYHGFCEKKVIKSALFNVGTSKYLYEKMHRINRNTYEIMLGVTPFVLPEGYSGVNEPKKNKILLGLMGIINSRQISVPLFNELTQCPDFELVVIGPVEEEFMQKIRNRDRIVFTGALKGNDLMEAMMKIDVGLAVYNVNRVNPGATPNKLWQYLSIGKPVVISRLPNIRQEIFPGDSVYLINDTDPIKELVVKAHMDNSKEKAMERIIFAREHTWDQRAADFEILLERYLKK